MTEQTIERMIRVPEIVAATGFHPDTIYAAIDRGELRATKRFRQWLVRASDYEAWLVDGEPEAPADAPVSSVPIPSLTPSQRKGGRMKSRVANRGDRAASAEGREGQLPRQVDGPDGQEARQDIPA